MKRLSLSFALSLLAVAAQAGPKEDLQTAWDKGAASLTAKQNADGGWGLPAFGPGSDVSMTGMAVAALSGSEAGRKKYADAITKGCD